MDQEVTNRDLAVSLAQAHAKLDALLADQADHETRLRALEKVRWIGHGIWLVLGAGLAWLAKHF